MGLRHVYVQDILNTTMVVVLQVLFNYEIIYEMGSPMSEKQLKESQSRAAPLSSPNRGLGRDIVNLSSTFFNNRGTIYNSYYPKL